MGAKKRVKKAKLIEVKLRRRRPDDLGPRSPLIQVPSRGVDTCLVACADVAADDLGLKGTFYVSAKKPQGESIKAVKVRYDEMKDAFVSYQADGLDYEFGLCEDYLVQTFGRIPARFYIVKPEGK